MKLHEMCSAFDELCLWLWVGTEKKIYIVILNLMISAVKAAVLEGVYSHQGEGSILPGSLLLLVSF